MSYLADTSVLARWQTRSKVRETMDLLLLENEVATCGVVELEVLYSACAERAGLTVLHYDADYERIAELTGQPTRWVVPRGSIS